MQAARAEGSGIGAELVEAHGDRLRIRAGMHPCLGDRERVHGIIHRSDHTGGHPQLLPVWARLRRGVLPDSRCWWPNAHSAATAAPKEMPANSSGPAVAAASSSAAR